MNENYKQDWVTTTEADYSPIITAGWIFATEEPGGASVLFDAVSSLKLEHSCTFRQWLDSSESPAESIHKRKDSGIDESSGDFWEHVMDNREPSADDIFAFVQGVDEMDGIHVMMDL